MSLFSIFDRKSADSYIVEQKLHAISNQCSISAWELAKLVEKIDAILLDKKALSHIEQNDEIELGALRAKLSVVVADMIVVSKIF